MAWLSRSIIAFATIHLIVAVTSQELEKRGPQGFLGMRGKKMVESEQFYKRRPQFFVGVKGKKNMYDINDEFEPEYFKRAMGFMGMRGKKDLFFDDKRAPMGFVGMRGKKDMFSDEKRAPMGFVGMRGKKEFYSDEEKRASMGFMGMRGKKDFYSDEEKRAPMGFVGMRGKKSFYSDEEKRAPMGFVGMRGKKDIFYQDKQAPVAFGDKKNIYDDAYPETFEYLPERGSLVGQIDYASQNNNSEFPVLYEVLVDYLKKLEAQNQVETATEAIEPNEGERFTNEVEKRAASIHQFFGVRGKKSLQNKRPYDVSFRGKFIGVRGKKDVKSSGAQEIKFLVDNASYPKRKGSMGFIGMRGKKWTDESSPETDTLN